MIKNNLNQNKRHFLVIAAVSRGARFFIKKALTLGHSVTGLCRAESDKAAFERLNKLLNETILTDSDAIYSEEKGKLYGKSNNILDPNCYKSILTENSDIDAVVCFVGAAASFKEQYSHNLQIYTKTYGALIEGMEKSRWVETFIHGSSGSEGTPGKHKYIKLPSNFRLKWLIQILGNTPAAQNYFESEYILANAKKKGLHFILFRPAFLTSATAKRNYEYSIDKSEELANKKTKMTISREDVAEEILRVTLLSEDKRNKYYGHGVYLVDLK